jgi:hypothetical protein
MITVLSERKRQEERRGEENRDNMDFLMFYNN